MQNLTYKILEKHLLKGKLEAGQPIEIKMDTRCHRNYDLYAV